MKPRILSEIMASEYKREILSILTERDLETPTGMLKRMVEKGHKSANKQNVSSNLRWLRNYGLVRVEVDRPKGRLYRITDEGRQYSRRISK